LCPEGQGSGRPVAVIETRRGFREFGGVRPQQVIVWKALMNAQTLLRTANTETVYGLGFLDRRRPWRSAGDRRDRAIARRAG
jgi:hypothetical protein